MSEALQYATSRIEQAEMWLAMYSRKRTDVRRLLVEHNIALAKYYIATARVKEKLKSCATVDSDVVPGDGA